MKKKNKRVIIDFEKTYEPAMIERYGRSSFRFMNEFNEELGIKFLTCHEIGGEDIPEYEIVDEKKFLLAKIKYGF